MQHLEGSQYTTRLDLNRGYYTIRLFPASQYMMAIVTKFGRVQWSPYGNVIF